MIIIMVIINIMYRRKELNLNFMKEIIENSQLIYLS